jgi:hypothetical protein
MKRMFVMALTLALTGLALAQATAPATKPATAPATTSGVIKLEDLIAKLPADLKPTVGEAADHKTARDTWFKNEVGDKALQLSMQVAGLNMDIEPHTLNGYLAPNTNIDAHFDRGAPAVAVKMGDDVVIEGTMYRINIIPAGRVAVTINSVKVVSVTPKK